MSERIRNEVKRLAAIKAERDRKARKRATSNLTRLKKRREERSNKVKNGEDNTQ